MKKFLGVGLVVFCAETKRVLVIEELEDKPSVQKKAGMLSIPLETVENEKGETSGFAVQRLMTEEIGQKIQGQFFFFGRTFSFPYADIAAAYIVCKDEFEACPEDDDIAYHGWMTPEDLMALPRDQQRGEVKEILKSFMEGVLPQLT